MTRSARVVFAAFLTGVVLPAASIAGPSGVAADHHMHIVSPAGAEADRKFCEKIGMTDGCEDEKFESSTGAYALRALDAAGIEDAAIAWI